jgi:hypothetical protein
MQMRQLSATTCSCIAILWVSLVSFASITIYVASQRVFIVVSVYFIIDSVRKLLETPSYAWWPTPTGHVNTVLTDTLISGSVPKLPTTTNSMQFGLYVFWMMVSDGELCVECSLHFKLRQELSSLTVGFPLAVLNSVCTWPSAYQVTGETQLNP